MSVKNCPKCGKQGLCHDSRQQREYVRRRYHCVMPGCAHTWTTAEFLIEEGDSKDKHKVRHYRERQQKAAALKAVERLRTVLEAEVTG